MTLDDVRTCLESMADALELQVCQSEQTGRVVCWFRDRVTTDGRETRVIRVESPGSRLFLKRAASENHEGNAASNDAPFDGGPADLRGIVEHQVQLVRRHVLNEA
ncbi:hypothetical protein GCT13_02210 [Paraburkholderia sp. CNPSo 3157]|uniref:Uncharacterized protein n=1 Tax=Paraburkholderia franconis TaxID=2654983 RepID=A0A7X1N675_9BURK|nr:hypothetical protein [Paraburkholderia franconis]MPW15758.1 hypothetical protein [Paraburkholderia franconis]